MRETTSALTRVAVLALVTCSFAAAWSSDRQTQVTYALARKEDWQRRLQLALVRGSLVACAADPCSGSECDRETNSAGQRPLERVTVEMALPADITPGRYRVVGPAGRTVTIVVSELSDRGASSAAKSVSVVIIPDDQSPGTTLR